MHLLFIIALAQAAPLVVSQVAEAGTKVALGVDAVGHLFGSGQGKGNADKALDPSSDNADFDGHKKPSSDNANKPVFKTPEVSSDSAASEFYATTAGQKAGHQKALVRKEAVHPHLSASSSEDNNLQVRANSAEDSHLQVLHDDHHKADDSHEDPTELAEELATSEVLDELEAMTIANAIERRDGGQRRRGTGGPRRRAINCVWSEWSSDGECSATCGGGIEIFSKKEETKAEHGGAVCEGPGVKEEKCSQEACPTTTMPLMSDVMCMYDLTFLRLAGIFIMACLVTQ
jgi:hypothetical protein